MTVPAPTLEDVARKAGVSTATVSRCFNTPDRVVLATREKVFRIVKELEYTPHFGGRALASNRSNTIGAVIPTMDNAIFARALQAFQEALAEAGVTLLVASSCYDPERELEQIRALVGRGADGLLLIGAARPEESYNFLARRNIPHVIAWSYHANSTNYYAGFDNEKAAFKLAELVIEYGHHNIAMITGLTHSNDRAADRIMGVRKALDKAGLQGDQMELIETTYSLEGGAKAMEKLMQHSPRPTAVICGNDVLAVSAIIKARQLGLNVPEDVSVTGFDDIDLAMVVEPTLTTVHVPHKRMGQAAAQLILNLRDKKAECHSVELETHIVVRESLGKPPQKHAL